MTFCVLDASVGLTWFFGDRATPATDEILSRVLAEGCVAPGVWPWEMSNVLLKSARRARLPVLTSERELRFLEILLMRGDVSIDVPDVGAFARATALAMRHALSSYDAAYLELSRRRALPLATLDRALSRAALGEGLPVLPAPA